jgi:hypothetical protein
MKGFRTALQPDTMGTITWHRASGGKLSAGFLVSGNPDALLLVLCYRWDGVERVTLPVRLQNTPTQFGGLRWWFTCPLTIGGVACDRRAGKLYLPPGARHFGCRVCHRLAYRSSQQAHQAERRAKSMERQLQAVKAREGMR